jgi:hypothetical protein
VASEAFELLAEGEMARAVKRLCSLGVCDGRLDVIQRQLAMKHPKRVGSFLEQSSFPAVAADDRLQLGRQAYGTRT